VGFVKSDKNILTYINI